MDLQEGSRHGTACRPCPRRSVFRPRCPLCPLSTSPKRLSVLNCCVYKRGCEQNGKKSGGRSNEVCWRERRDSSKNLCGGGQFLALFLCLGINFRARTLESLRMLVQSISETCSCHRSKLVIKQFRTWNCIHIMNLKSNFSNPIVVLLVVKKKTKFSISK
jgi:hypothetical protein